MKIFRPVSTNLITQGFGVAKTQPSLIPLYNSIGLKSHDGLDFSVSCKDNHIKTGGQCEQVYCNVDQDLKITYIQKDVDNGYGIIACNGDWKFLWWHFDSINPILSVGARISSGDLLGVAGNTGMSTGAHVHFAVYKYGDDYNNGYHGASDPEPYFTNIFILDELNLLKKMLWLLQQQLNLLTKK